MASVVPLTPDNRGEWERPNLNSGKARADAEAGSLSIGLELCRARQRSGKTLTDIANQTKIAAHHLMAIERNRFDVLPGRVYAIGFVRNYAACVGLDPEALAARVKAELPAPDDALTLVNLLPPSNRKVPDSELAGTDGTDEHVGALADPPKHSWLQAAAFLLLISGGIYSTYAVLSSASQVAQPPVFSAPVVADVQDQVVPRPPAVAEQPAPPPSIEPATPSPASPTPPAFTTVPPTDVTQTETVVPLLLGSVEVTPSLIPERPPVAEATPEVASDLAPPPPAIVRPKPALPVVVASRAPPPQATLVSQTVPRVRAPLPLGHHYGTANTNARIILRVHRPIHVAVRGPGSRIFLDQTLDAGDTYRVPNMVGLKLSAPDAGAIEVILDDTTVGFASKDGVVAKDLPLDPQSIVDRQNR